MSASNIDENIRGKKRIVLQNLKTIGKYKKLQNNTKVSIKNMIFNNVADLRSSGYSKLAELLLVNSDDLKSIETLNKFAKLIQ